MNDNHIISVDWFVKIPGLVRVPVIEESEHCGYVVIYEEKSRLYKLMKFDTISGRTIWQTEVENGGYGTPAIGMNIIAMASGFSNIIGIDKLTGEVVWRYETTARVRSSISYKDRAFTFSSGGSIHTVSEFGQKIFSKTNEGSFLFGKIEIAQNKLYSMGAFNDGEGSKIYIYEIDYLSKPTNSVYLGEGTVASSDCSGFVLLDDGDFVVGTKTSIVRSNFSGQNKWACDINGSALRHTVSVDSDYAYYSTLKGEVGCVRLDNGEHVWKRSYDLPVLTKVQVWDKRVLFITDGYLFVLDSLTGALINSYAVGHSPYSYPVIFGDSIYLGAGDPPYKGLLWKFDKADKAVCGSEIHAKTQNCYVGTKGFDLTIYINKAGVKGHIQTIEADFSTISPNNNIVCTPIEGGYTFSGIEVLPNVSVGYYVIPLKLKSEYYTVYDGVIVKINRKNPIPTKRLISSYQINSQEDTRYSGAAVVQSAQEYYGMEPSEQADIRAMVDYVKGRSGYEAFNTWRIILRRVANSSAKKLEELPEYTSNSTKS